MGDFQHVAPDGFAGSSLLRPCRSISREQETVSTAADPDNGRIFVPAPFSFSSFRCLHNIQYTIFLLYFLI